MSMQNIILTTLGSVGGVGGGVILGKVMNDYLGYDSKASMLNGIAMSYSLARYYYGNLDRIKPSAVIGGIPLGTIEELSHGISDRDVRYRANGGIFLAHQDGGNESLRIVGKAYGPNRFIFLNMLDLLFLYGSSTRIDLLKLQSEAAKTSPPFHYYTDFSQLVNLPVNKNRVVVTRPDGTQAIVDVARRVEANNQAWEEFDLKNIGTGYHDRHLTFPVITKHRIYLSMYIETYSWRQSVDRTGMKQIEYTIFFRKYDPEPKYEFKKMVFPTRGDKAKTKIVYRQKEENHPLYNSMIKAAVELFPSFMINIFDVGKYVGAISNKFMNNIAGVGTNNIEMKQDIEGEYF